MSKNELTEFLLGREIAIRFVSLREVIAIHDGSIERVGGKLGVLDINLLESALHKSMQKCIYENDMDLYSLAATLADGLAQNRAFLDGNKRTAFLSCIKFLEHNDIMFSPDVDEAIEMFRQLASHAINAEELASWIKETVEAEKLIERFRE